MPIVHYPDKETKWKNISFNLQNYEMVKALGYIGRAEKNIVWYLDKNSLTNNKYTVMVPEGTHKLASLLIELYEQNGNIDIYLARKSQLEEERTQKDLDRGVIDNFKAIAESYVDEYKNYNHNDFCSIVNKLYKLILKICLVLDDLPYYGLEFSSESFNKIELLDLKDWNEFYTFNNCYDDNTAVKQNLNGILSMINNILLTGLKEYWADIYLAAAIWKQGLSYKFKSGKKLVQALLPLCEICDICSTKNIQLGIFDDNLIIEDVVEETIEDDEKKEQIEKIDSQIKKEIEKNDNDGIKKEKAKELLEFLREKMCFVKIINQGIRFRNKKMPIKNMAEVIGIKDEEVKKQLESSWKLFVDSQEVKNLSVYLEKKITLIKERNLIKIGEYDWILLKKNGEQWDNEINSFREKDIKRTITRFKSLNNAIGKNKQKLKDTIIGTIIKTRGTDGNSNEDINALIERYERDIDDEFKDIEKLCDEISVDYITTALDEKTLKDERFWFELAVKIFNDSDDYEFFDMCSRLSNSNMYEIQLKAEQLKDRNRKKVESKFRRLFNNSDKNIIRSAYNNLKFISEKGTFIAYAANCKYIAYYVKDVHKIYIEDMDKSETAFYIDVNNGGILDLSICSEYIAFIHDECRLRIWDITWKNEVIDINMGAKCSSGIKFSRDGRYLGVCLEESIFIYDTSNRSVTTFEINGQHFNSFDFAQNNYFVIINSFYGSLYFLELKDLKILNGFHYNFYDYYILGIELGYKGQSALVVCSDDKFRIWNLVEKKITFESRRIPGLKTAIFLNNQNILAVGEDFIMIDIKTKDEYRIKEEINYFDTKHITDAEQCLVLCCYYGITNECIELEIKNNKIIEESQNKA